MFLGSSGINFKLYRMLYGLPGGNQVDGLPPASSTDSGAASWLPGRLQTYSENLGSFFKKS